MPSGLQGVLSLLGSESGRGILQPTSKDLGRSRNKKFLLNESKAVDFECVQLSRNKSLAAMPSLRWMIKAVLDVLGSVGWSDTRAQGFCRQWARSVKLVPACLF